MKELLRETRELELANDAGNTNKTNGNMILFPFYSRKQLFYGLFSYKVKLFGALGELFFIYI